MPPATDRPPLANNDATNTKPRARPEPAARPAVSAAAQFVGQCMSPLAADSKLGMVSSPVSPKTPSVRKSVAAELESAPSVVAVQDSKTSVTADGGTKVEACKKRPLEDVVPHDGEAPVKKKKKKSSFKNMMAAMLAPKKSDKEKTAEHKQAISKSLGGGGFSKLEKI
jgi:hypothetical protein